MTPVAVSLIGAGGMGEVYLAQVGTPEGGLRFVALKRIRAALLNDPAVRARFEREARVSALLRHPNIVATLEQGADAQGPFLVLEYVEGQSAASLIAEARRRATHVPVAAAFAILHAVAEGLAFAHEYVNAAEGVFGIVHRDLSPDNVLIGYDGTTRLADFGIARILGGTELTGTGRVVGKSGYISPEAYEGLEPDTRSDVFSFGATAFQLLSGTQAFRGESEAATMRAVLSVTPPLVSALCVEVPATLANLVARCLEKRPDIRPDMRAVARELQGLLGPNAHEAVGALLTDWFGDRRALMPVAERADRRTATGVAAAPSSWVPRAVLAGVLAVTLGGGWWLTRTAPRVAPATAPPEPAAVVDRVAPEVAPVAPVEEPAPKPDPERAPRQRPRAAHATLRIRVTPWAEVFLDGTLLGQTPLPVQQVEPGVHSLILVNAELGVRNSYQVRVKPGEQRTFAINLPVRAQ